MTEPLPTLRTVLWRGLRRRCPHCGEGAIFKGWIKMHDGCAACGLKYLQDQGDLWAFLVVVDRVVFVLPLIVLIFFRLYVPSAAWFYITGVVLLIGFIYTLPYRNGMSLGLDFWIRRRWGDLSDNSSPPQP